MKGKSPPQLAVSPEKKGSYRRNPWHMSLDELIEYKSNGKMPAMILNLETIFNMATKGTSIRTICDVMGIAQSTFMHDPAYLEAHAKGLALLNVRNRMALVDHAEEGSLAATIHIDKMLNAETQKIDLTVKQNTDHLVDISDEELIRAIQTK